MLYLDFFPPLGRSSVRAPCIVSRAALNSPNHDTQLEADASELRLRAERRLGAMIDAEKRAGRIGPGQPKKNGNESEPFSRVKLADIGIDKQLSARSQKVAGLDAHWYGLRTNRTAPPRL